MAEYARHPTTCDLCGCDIEEGEMFDNLRHLSLHVCLDCARSDQEEGA